jgi:hypothetical protein
MARTTFSGPVRAGYQGGDASAQQPLTPTTINTGSVIPVDEGTATSGFYARVMPTVGFGSSDYQTPVRLLPFLVEFKQAHPLRRFPLLRLTTLLV